MPAAFQRIPLSPQRIFIRRCHILYGHKPIDVVLLFTALMIMDRS